MLLQVHADCDQVSFSLKWRMKYIVYYKLFSPLLFLFSNPSPSHFIFQAWEGWWTDGAKVQPAGIEAVTAGKSHDPAFAEAVLMKWNI